jgi:endogenous inhibitor of DNA gyrase (YacG/DUF329 family)
MPKLRARGSGMSGLGRNAARPQRQFEQTAPQASREAESLIRLEPSGHVVGQPIPIRASENPSRSRHRQARAGGCFSCRRRGPRRASCARWVRSRRRRADVPLPPSRRALARGGLRRFLCANPRVATPSEGWPCSSDRMGRLKRCPMASTMPPESVCACCRRRPVVPAWRPFCSERCKLVDLGRWLSGEYRLAGEPVPADTPGEERSGVWGPASDELGGARGPRHSRKDHEDE